MVILKATLLLERHNKDMGMTSRISLYIMSCHLKFLNNVTLYSLYDNIYIIKFVNYKVKSKRRILHHWYFYMFYVYFLCVPSRLIRFLKLSLDQNLVVIYHKFNDNFQITSILWNVR